ncbi:Chemotaxis protein CheY homolog [Chlamydiales bacterium SCGC AG-110-M15]|nr:Chemotaxis protein CheY homolog [Chlamydiales bacterium SCGC AG-110-M15]
MTENKIKALIADDSQFMRQLIAEYLLSMGISKTFHAANGEQALKLLKENTDINLLICDWSMPKVDGLALAQEAKKILDDNCAYFLVTSENSPDVLKKFKDLGVTNYLIKPFAENDFQNAMKALINND